jgi:hypothetical protein
VEVGECIVVRPGDSAVLDEAEGGVVVYSRGMNWPSSRDFAWLERSGLRAFPRDVRPGLSRRRHRGYYANAS